MNLHNFDLEQKVLTALLQFPEKFLIVSNLMDEELFVHPLHKLIFKKFYEMQLHNEYDFEKLLLSFDEEQRNKVMVLLVANYSYDILIHARILKEYWVKRKINNAIIKLTQNLEENADAFELLNELDTLTYDIMQKLIQGNLKHISEFSLKMFDEIMQMQDPNFKINSIPLQNEKINSCLYRDGLIAKRLYGIAARPGEGKTSYLVDFIANNIDKNILFYSLEMTSEEIIEMMLANQTLIDPNRIIGKSKEKLSSPELIKIGDKLGKFKDYNIYFDDDSSWHIDKLRVDIRNNVKKFKIDVVLIDYLQLIDGSGGTRITRESQVTYVANQLKTICKVATVPVFVSIQLNRDVDKNEKPQPPKLNQMRESGGIEQALDVAIAIYDEKEKFNIEKGLAEVKLLILKNRRGKKGFEKVVFNKPYSAFLSNAVIDGTFDDLEQELAEQEVKAEPGF